MEDGVNNRERLDRLAEADEVEAAVQAAVMDALLKHKRAGNFVIGWRNGQIERVPAEQIVVQDEADVEE